MRVEATSPNRSHRGILQADSSTTTLRSRLNASPNVCRSHSGFAYKFDSVKDRVSLIMLGEPQRETMRTFVDA